MKFVKTTKGGYINKNKIEALAVREYFDYPTGDNSGFAVCAFVRGERWSLKEFSSDPKSTTQFNPKEAAQAWLDEFVAELNTEN